MYVKLLLTAGEEGIKAAKLQQWSLVDQLSLLVQLGVIESPFKVAVAV